MFLGDLEGAGTQAIFKTPTLLGLVKSVKLFFSKRGKRRFCWWGLLLNREKGSGKFWPVAEILRLFQLRWPLYE